VDYEIALKETSAVAHKQYSCLQYPWRGFYSLKQTHRGFCVLRTVFINDMNVFTHSKLRRIHHVRFPTRVSATRWSLRYRKVSKHWSPNYFVNSSTVVQTHFSGHFKFSELKKQFTWW